MRISARKQNASFISNGKCDDLHSFRRGVFYHAMKKIAKFLERTKLFEWDRAFFYGAISFVKTINIIETMSNNWTIFLLVCFPAPGLELGNCIWHIKWFVSCKCNYDVMTDVIFFYLKHTTSLVLLFLCRPYYNFDLIYFVWLKH